MMMYSSLLALSILFLFVLGFFELTWTPPRILETGYSIRLRSFFCSCFTSSMVSFSLTFCIYNSGDVDGSFNYEELDICSLKGTCFIDCTKLYSFYIIIFLWWFTTFWMWLFTTFLGLIFLSRTMFGPGFGRSKENFLLVLLPLVLLMVSIIFWYISIYSSFCSNGLFLGNFGERLLWDEFLWRSEC